MSSYRRPGSMGAGAFGFGVVLALPGILACSSDTSGLQRGSDEERPVVHGASETSTVEVADEAPEPSSEPVALPAFSMVNDETESRPLGPDQICHPGQQWPCMGGEACLGEQHCMDDGRAVGACVCLPADVSVDGLSPAGILKVGLVAHWRFDDGVGSVITDASGNGNHGQMLEGGTVNALAHQRPSWTLGKQDQAIEMDGIDDWIRVPASPSLNTINENNAVTVAAWVFPHRHYGHDGFAPDPSAAALAPEFSADTSIGRTLESRLRPLPGPHNGGGGAVVILQRHENRSRTEHFGLGTFAGLPSGAVHFFKAVGPENVPLKNWVHMAMSYDGIKTRIFVDGKEVSWLDVGWSFFADETPISIGAGINETDVLEHFNGQIDDIRLYNRRLSAVEVQALSREN